MPGQNRADSYLQSAANTIGDAIEARRMADHKKMQEEAVAKAKLAAVGIPYTPEHDTLLKRGATAEDVVGIAVANKRRQDQERVLREAPDQPASQLAQLEATGRDVGERNANIDILAKGTPEQRQQVSQDAQARTGQMVKNKAVWQIGQSLESGRVPSYSERINAGDTPSKAISEFAADTQKAKRFKEGLRAGLSEGLAQAYADKLYSTIKAARDSEKPEKQTDSEQAKSTRQTIARLKNMNPDDPATQAYIAGVEMPGGKSAITPSTLTGDFEQSWRGVIKGTQDAQEKLKTRYPPPTAADSVLASMTPEQIRDSAFKETKALTRMKQDIAGEGQAPQGRDPEIDSLEAELQSLIEEFRRLRSGE